MIEQFGKDVVTIEQTKVAESSKILMQLMALMRRRLKENQIGIDLKEGTNVRIDVDGKTVFRGNESDGKVDQKVDPEILKNIAGLLESPRGTEIDSPYRDISIKINDREVFKVENGLVVMNEMTSRSVARENGGAGTANRPPLSRSEQLAKMADDLKGLELIEPLEKLVKERGKDEGKKKVLENEKYRFTLAEDKFTIHDKGKGRDIFERGVAEIIPTATSLTREDVREIGEFIERENPEKDREKPEEKEEDFPPLSQREDTEIER
jgi:hypothetical protein